MLFGLSKKGYGTVNELEQSHCETILNMMEYERIANAVEIAEAEKAKRKNKRGE